MPRVPVLSVLVLAAACAGAPPERHEKPRGPVAVTAVVSPVGGDEYDVLAEAVGPGPVEVRLRLPDGVERLGGALASSGMGRATARVRVRGPAGALVGAGGSPGGGQAAVTAVRLGDAPPPTPADHVVMTPFGPVAEAGR